MSGPEPGKTGGGSDLKLPSLPQLLLILLEIVILSVLIRFERTGIIGGVEYSTVLIGIVVYFAFLTKTACS
jgi:hypothetical protein